MRKNQIISLVIAIFCIYFAYCQEDNTMPFFLIDGLKYFISRNIHYFEWFFVGVFISLFSLKNLKGAIVLSILISTVSIFFSIIVNYALFINSNYFLAIVLLALSLRNTSACNDRIFSLFMMEKNFQGEKIRKKINKIFIF